MTTLNMAKIDPKLRYFQELRRSTQTKTYKDPATNYIIISDGTKLSDYDPVEGKSNPSRITPPSSNAIAKVPSPNIFKSISTQNTSGIKKPTSLPVYSSGPRSTQIKSPGSGLKKPNILPGKPSTTTHKLSKSPPSVTQQFANCPLSTTQALVTSSGIKMPKQLHTHGQTTENLPTSSTKSFKKSFPVSTKTVKSTAPAIPPKPVLPKEQIARSPSKISHTSGITNCRVNQPASKSVASATKKHPTSLSTTDKPSEHKTVPALSVTGGSKSKHLTKPPIRQENVHSPSKAISASQSSNNVKSVSRIANALPRVSPPREQPKKIGSPPRSMTNSINSGKVGTTNLNTVKKHLNHEQTVSEAATTNTCTGVDIKLKPQSNLAKFGARLVLSPRITSGIKNTANLSSTVSPRITHCATTETLFINLQQSSVITPTVLSQNIPQSHHYRSHAASSTVTLSFTTCFDICCELQSVREILAVCTNTPKSSILPVSQLESSSITKTQSFCLPTRTSCDVDEVFHVTPFTANAEETQCYAYLQQTSPSSFRKQLINSFAVKEQLSPTAECHAQHIASSMPQPWLSADIMDNDSSRSSSINLIIPDPPISDSLDYTSKLQSIDEDDEPLCEANIPKLPLPSSILASEIADEPADEVIIEHRESQSISALKSPGLFGNFLSKIGGRRILTRPQESPPRIRKPSGKTDERKGANSVSSRHKLSPKTRRREVRNTSQVKLTENGSPKHKPAIQDDSPIRAKEAYYGGTHHHMLRPKNEEEQCYPTGRLSEPTAIRRCDTPIDELSEMCRDDHMKFYTYSYGRTGQAAHEKGLISHPNMMTANPLLSTSLNHKRKHKNSADEGAKHFTHYSSLLRMGLPQCPDFTRDHIEQGNTALSKVSVAVRLKPSGETTANTTSSYVVADPARAQLILRDPSNESNMAPSCRRQLAAVPKFFAFDTVFGSDAMQMDVCKGTVLDILQSVLQGSDACVTSFGQSKTGKSRSLIGDDSSCTDFGIIPTAISWLYHQIEEQKNKTGARFSIRISALEIRGKNEDLTDLLADHAPGQENTPADQVQLTNTPVYGAQIENLNELRAPDAEQAGYYLDAALTTSHSLNESSGTKGSHFLFTLHIYQHHVESKPAPGGALVAGGRSRLHFIDIGPCAKSSSDGSALTLAALGSAITALLNGQKHFPQKESKLATLLKESVGHSNCRTCILVHISTQPSQYSETLQILQLAARIHRMKVRRRSKISSNSSDDTGSANSNLRRRRGIRMGTSASLSDPDVSSSEQSVDTVIYVPGNKHRHQHQSPTVYRTNPVVSKRHDPHSMGRCQGQPTVNGSACTASPSPYNKSGAIKKKLSDDETSSEGRRRMPRTNARVWPRANHNEDDVIGQREYWLDAAPPSVPRDQWHIPGNANPLPHNNYYSTLHQAPHYHHHQQQYQQQYQQHQHIDAYNVHHYAAPDQAWISLAQYNGHPGQIGQVAAGARLPSSPARQAWVDHPPPDQKNVTYPEIAKQELWVDGPTAFRKNIEGLTSNLHTDQLSPTKKPHRHHHSTNHSGERGDKPKHHRTPSRKHRESNKHCHQCGADIKKEPKEDASNLPSKAEEPKVTETHNMAEEPTVCVKPFVKDWVLRHSKNNTPNKTSEECETKHLAQKGERKMALLDSKTRDERLAEEINVQEEMQLTIDLGMCTDEDLMNLHNLPCSDHLLDDLDCQDEVQIDDSVSNVTADDRVGFESKEGSSFDENSLSEEVVEVCDAACQTEFTDSDTHSVQSNTMRSTDSLKLNLQGGVTVRTALNSLGRNVAKRDSTEAFLNATLQGAMLRKPDGASDPSLHKEFLSPTSEHKYANPAPQTKLHSNTLPRNTHLMSNGSIPQQNAQHVSQEQMQETIKVQPYLFTPRQSSQHSASTLPRPGSTLPRPGSTLPRPGSSQPANKEVPELTTTKNDSKVKKPSLSRQPSSDGSDKQSASKIASSSPGKKSKGSKLPSLRFSTKPKEPKPSNSIPSTPTKKAETSKKEKKSMLRPPTGSKSPLKHEINIPTTTSRLPPPVYSSSPRAHTAVFDVTSSPYRHYVLPKPSYAHSDGFSDNSSCPSNPLAQNKYSVSSGYDSMTLNSAEDFPQTTEDNPTERSTAGPWLNHGSSGTMCKELARIQQQRQEESQLSENVTRQSRIEELLYRQNLLKREMADTKSRLMVSPTSWTFDLHVASQIDRRNDEGYLEALEKETSILQNRVDACKSRIMLVTSIL